jgi:hypothetical protein
LLAYPFAAGSVGEEMLVADVEWLLREIERTTVRSPLENETSQAFLRTSADRYRWRRA